MTDNKELSKIVLASRSKYKLEDQKRRVSSSPLGQKQQYATVQRILASKNEHQLLGANLCLPIQKSLLEGGSPPGQKNQVAKRALVSYRKIMLPW